MGHKVTTVQQQQGDSHLKHNSLISIIPWLSFLASTQCCFSLIYLLWPPLGVLALHSFSTRTRPFPISLLPIGSGYFRANFPYEYPNNLIPVILPTYNTYEDVTERV